MLNHYLCYGDNDSPSRCGWGTVPPAPVLVPGQMMVRRFLSTKSTAELVGQKKGLWVTLLFSFLQTGKLGHPALKEVA